MDSGPELYPLVIVRTILLVLYVTRSRLKLIRDEVFKVTSLMIGYVSVFIIYVCKCRNNIPTHAGT